MWYKWNEKGMETYMKWLWSVNQVVYIRLSTPQSDWKFQNWNCFKQWKQKMRYDMNFSIFWCGKHKSHWYFSSCLKSNLAISLFQVYLAFNPMTAGIGSIPVSQNWISGRKWMDELLAYSPVSNEPTMHSKRSNMVSVISRSCLVLRSICWHKLQFWLTIHGFMHLKVFFTSVFILKN